MYFNTTGEPDTTPFELATMKQDKQLFHIFKLHKKPLGASDLFRILENVPITSIRRSLTTLFQNETIKRVGKKKGMYGRNEYTYLLR